MAAADEQPEQAAVPPRVPDELALAPATPQPLVDASRAAPQARPRRRRWVVPLALYVATLLSTFAAGSFRPTSLGGFYFALADGLVFSAAVMTILTLHELGHFFAALRHGVPASLPYFLPMPISPFGTMGAVILMPARMGHRRALFDIGIAGPLAGLVPAVAFTVMGLQQMPVSVDRNPLVQHGPGGSPLLFTWLYDLLCGPLAAGQRAPLHPLAFAGWAGLFFTALNLLPVGQLDGGHVLYALLRRKAHYVSLAVYFGLVAAVIGLGYWMWWLMLLLLFLMDVRHPPTANDDEPLGLFRSLLGWATLLLFPLGFTPTPFFIGR